MNRQQLIDFECMVAAQFEMGEIHSPIHLSGGNENQLIDIFSTCIIRNDIVFSTHRSHYHALLHGINPALILEQIANGHSMNLNFPSHDFYTSAIVGGNIPIALGAAQAIKLGREDRKVFCFIGDMAASMGIFREAQQFAAGHDLPITFVIEDNGMSTDSPTDLAWGKLLPLNNSKVIYYQYERTWPHCGTGKFVSFV